MSAVTPRREEHLPGVAALEGLCFSRPWSEDALREELHNPAAHFLVMEEAGAVIGYIGLHAPADEGFIANVAVHPAHRRKGVAARLLAAAREWAEERHLFRLTLEVRVSNTAAIALYEGAGYVKDGVRPRFYERPAEDAAIYSLYLSNE